MNGAQKVIKTLAVAFAAMIIVGIVSMIVGVGMIVDRVFWAQDNVARVDEEWNATVISDKVEKLVNLEIELKSTSLKIEQGDEFQVVADAEVIDFWQDGETVHIKEKDFDFLWRWHQVGGEVKVVLPKTEEGGSLKRFSLNMGAGEVTINDITMEELDVDLGAGRADFTKIVATRRAEVDGGAGLLVMREAELRDFDLDMGVGKVEVSAKLEGDSKISAGVGKLELTLIGEEDDYRVSFDQGLGAMNQQGISLENPNGRNRVEIDGGVGAIDLRLAAE